METREERIQFEEYRVPYFTGDVEPVVPTSSRLRTTEEVKLKCSKEEVGEVRSVSRVESQRVKGLQKRISEGRRSFEKGKVLKTEEE